MGKYDQADQIKLQERVGYERIALDFARHELYRQSEEAEGPYSLKLRDLLSNPDSPKATLSIQSFASLPQEAVNKVLSKFIPLIFASSFKVNDMIVEWIFPPPPKGRWYSFKEKVEFYEKTKPPQPPLFDKIPYLETCTSSSKIPREKRAANMTKRNRKSLGTAFKAKVALTAGPHMLFTRVP